MVLETKSVLLTPVVTSGKAVEETLSKPANSASEIASHSATVNQQVQNVPRSSNVEDVKSLINSAISRENYSKINEVISFDEYLNRIIENPKLVRTSIQRIYDMIMSEGRETALIDGETLYRYKFFTSPNNPDDAISGIEKPLHQLMQKIEGAANQSGPDKRIILLVGPVGSAKTTIVRIVKEGLENYTKTDEGALYGIQWDLKDENGKLIFSDLGELKDCGVHDDPFKLIPNEKGSKTRDSIINDLNKRMQGEAASQNKILPYRFNAKGDVCPSCRDIFDRLVKHYDGNAAEALKHAKAKRVVLDEDKRVGLTTYEPRDEKSHDVEQLTGTASITGLMKSGSDSDPQSFNFDGELCLSNRGLAHFDEIFKLPKEMLYVLLTAAQDRKYKATKFAQIAFDGFLIGTTNIPDWEKVRNDKHQEAIRNRVIDIPVPYNGRINDEMKIYNKSFVRSAESRNIHISPHAIAMAALWAVMTRLGEPKAGITMLQKALLYNGEQLKDFTPYKVQQMKKDVPDEVMELLKGISPRSIENALAAAQAHPDVRDEENGSRCISPYLVLDCLEAELSTGTANLTQKEKVAFKSLLKEAEIELDNLLKKDVHRAIAGGEEDMQNLFNAYKRNILAWRKNEKVDNPVTGRLVDPDEVLMKAIENKLDITDSSRDTYRRWFIEQFALASEEKPFTYKTDSRLRKALEDVLVDRHSDITISLPDINKETASSKEQKQLEIIKSRLIEMFKYCDHCADIALTQAASPKNRGTSHR